MALKDKRYFIKRESSQTEQNLISQSYFELEQKDLPHIFRRIPALLNSSSGVFWGVFTTVLYSGIVFFVIIQLNIFFPLPQKSTSFADDLINSPLSYRSHLLYLESLTVKNRLEESQHELDFLHISQGVLSPTPEELSSLFALQNSISARKIVFHTTIQEYNHLSEILSANPDYRDILYALGQRSYMLFDDVHAKGYIQESVDLDPQFEQGKKVLRMMGK